MGERERGDGKRRRRRGLENEGGKSEEIKNRRQ